MSPTSKLFVRCRTCNHSSLQRAPRSIQSHTQNSISPKPVYTNCALMVVRREACKPYSCPSNKTTTSATCVQGARKEKCEMHMNSPQALHTCILNESMIASFVRSSLSSRCKCPSSSRGACNRCAESESQAAMDASGLESHEVNTTCPLSTSLSSELSLS